MSETDRPPLTPQQELWAIRHAADHAVAKAPEDFPLITLLILERHMRDISRMADALERIAAFYEKGLQS